MVSEDRYSVKPLKDDLEEKVMVLRQANMEVHLNNTLASIAMITTADVCLFSSSFQVL